MPAGSCSSRADDRLRLVSLDGLPTRLRGRTADLASSTVGELMRSGKTVMMATAEAGRFDDLIWSALPGLHTITLSLSHVGLPHAVLYALYSRQKVGRRRAGTARTAGHASVALSNATAYEEVVRQRAHERAVIDASADGIAVLDEDGLVRQWNPADEVYRRAARAGHGQAAAVPAARPGSQADLQAGQRPLARRAVHRPGGRRRTGPRLPRRHGVKGARRGQGPVPATTSHELRTPITVVQGFASTLASRWEKLSDSDRRSAVQTIADRGGRAGQAGGTVAARLPGLVLTSPGR